jgi:hypothetical protein
LSAQRVDTIKMSRWPSDTFSSSPSSCGAAHDDPTFAHCMGLSPKHRAASFRYDGRRHLVLLGGFVRNQQAQRIDELTPWAWKARVEAAALASTAAAA